MSFQADIDNVCLRASFILGFTFSMQNTSLLQLFELFFPSTNSYVLHYVVFSLVKPREEDSILPSSTIIFFRSNFRRKLTLTSGLCRTRQLARPASFTPLKRRSYIVKCFPVSRKCIPVSENISVFRARYLGQINEFVSGQKYIIAR